MTSRCELPRVAAKQRSKIFKIFIIRVRKDPCAKEDSCEMQSQRVILVHARYKSVTFFIFYVLKSTFISFCIQNILIFALVKSTRIKTIKVCKVHTINNMCTDRTLKRCRAMTQEIIPYRRFRLLLILSLLAISVTCVRAQKQFALSNNLVHSAVLTPNLRFEARTDTAWSFALSFGYRPWPRNDERARKYHIST